MKADKIRWLYANLKINLDRSRMWISYGQFLLMLIIIFRQYRDKGLGKIVCDHPYISYPIIIVLFAIVCIGIGYLDKILGLREAENKRLNRFNPPFMEMMRDVKEIKDKLNEKPDDR